MDYQLTIRFSFSAIDDVEARTIAHKIYENPECYIAGQIDIDYIIKLQKMFKDRAPEGLDHGLYSPTVGQ